MNTQIKSTIDIVNASFPSIFTKEDVVKLLTNLDEQLDNTKSNGSEIDKIKRIVSDAIIDSMRAIDWADMVDTSSAEFSLSGNEIYLESVDINERDVENQIRMDIYDALDNLQDESEGDSE